VDEYFIGKGFGPSLLKNSKSCNSRIWIKY